METKTIQPGERIKTKDKSGAYYHDHTWVTSVTWERKREIAYRAPPR